MLAAQATATKYMGLLESPSPRNMALMILYAVTNGMPRKQIVKYCFVPATAADGVAISAVIGPVRNSSPAVRQTDSPINRVTVLPIWAAAFSALPAPTSFAMHTVAPMASPTIMTVSICMT